MVNRETNFNRKKVNKLKSIRDRKRARLQRKKKAIGFGKNDSRPLTKKEERKQKRLERIYKELGQKDNKSNNIATILENKNRRRRIKNKRAHKVVETESKEGMQIDN